MIKRFLKSLKPKKSPKPPRQPIPPERPADIAPGPPELRVEPDATSPDDGGQNISDKDLEADQTDLPAPQNEGGRISPRVLFQDGMDGDQELPTSEGASTSVVAIGGAGGGNQLGSKCFRFLCRYRCWTTRSLSRAGCHDPRRWRLECFRRRSRSRSH